MSNRPSAEESPASLYQNAWDRGANPTLEKFLEYCGSLNTNELSEVLRVDLRQRWKSNERPSVETYLQRFPNLAADVESTIDLIYTEFLVRESLGEDLDLNEFSNRFPQYQLQLLSQIELHRLVDDQDAAIPLNSTLGQPNPVTRDNPSGELKGTFGRYELRRLLGSGGMGDVYLATDNVLHRSVAIKIPKQHLEDAPDTVKRFFREARLSAKLRHPNICAVFDVGQIDGKHFISMEYIEGETLSSYIGRNKTIPSSQAIDLMLPILDALDFSHRNGVLHRDLKPSNIMINAKGQPILMDFGLARYCFSEDGHITTSGDFLGTPSFASPEQIRGEQALIGPASDVYSMGAILFQMLTGRPPFVGNISMIIKQVLDAPAPNPTSLNLTVAKAIDKICKRALAKNPEDRFASPSEFARALQAARLEVNSSSRQVEEKGLALAGLPNKRNARRNWTIGLISLAVILLGIGLAAIRNRTSNNRETMPAGSVWTGQFSFAEDKSDLLPVQLIVTDREESAIRGQYRTEDKFEWTVSGSLIQNHLELRFVSSLSSGIPQTLIEHGRLSGTIRADKIETVFSDASDMTSAEFTLTRQK